MSPRLSFEVAMEGLAGFFFLGWIELILIRHYVWREPWFHWR